MKISLVNETVNLNSTQGRLVLWIHKVSNAIYRYKEISRIKICTLKTGDQRDKIKIL